jgi:hypothetical protein
MMKIPTIFQTAIGLSSFKSSPPQRRHRDGRSALALPTRSKTSNDFCGSFAYLRYDRDHALCASDFTRASLSQPHDPR